MKCKRLTAADRDDIRKESERQIRQAIGSQMKAYNKEILSIIAWALYEGEGYRKKRLSRVLKSIRPLLDELNERYELDHHDTIACVHRLHMAGLDIDGLLSDDDWIVAHYVGK